LTSDGVFEPGEIWTFILQDYFNAFDIPPIAFGSIGVPSFGSVDGSSGSIVVVFDDGGFGPVGGTSLPIDSTSLLLAGASVNVWMIPVVLSAAGFGILIARKI